MVSRTDGRVAVVHVLSVFQSNTVYTDATVIRIDLLGRNIDEAPFKSKVLFSLILFFSHMRRRIVVGRNFTISSTFGLSSAIFIMIASSFLVISWFFLSKYNKSYSFEIYLFLFSLAFLCLGSCYPTAEPALFFLL